MGSPSRQSTVDVADKGGVRQQKNALFDYAVGNETFIICNLLKPTDHHTNVIKCLHISVTMQSLSTTLQRTAKYHIKK